MHHPNHMKFYLDAAHEALPLGTLHLGAPGAVARGGLIPLAFPCSGFLEATARERRFACRERSTCEEDAAIKPYEFLLCTDNALMVVTGKGLEQFKITERVREDVPAELWPLFSIGLDQGLDNSCACNFLMYFLECNVEPDYDEDHGGHNDLTNVINESGMWGHQKLMDIARSAHQGPWGEARRHNELLDALQEARDLDPAAVEELVTERSWYILEEAGETGLGRRGGEERTARGCPGAVTARARPARGSTVA